MGFLTLLACSRSFTCPVWRNYYSIHILQARQQHVWLKSHIGFPVNITFVLRKAFGLLAFPINEVNDSTHLKWEISPCRHCLSNIFKNLNYCMKFWISHSCLHDICNIQFVHPSVKKFYRNVHFPTKMWINCTKPGMSSHKRIFATNIMYDRLLLSKRLRPVIESVCGRLPLPSSEILVSPKECSMYETFRCASVVHVFTILHILIWFISHLHQFWRTAPLLWW